MESAVAMALCPHCRAPYDPDIRSTCPACLNSVRPGAPATRPVPQRAAAPLTGGVRTARVRTAGVSRADTGARRELGTREVRRSARSARGAPSSTAAASTGETRAERAVPVIQRSRPRAQKRQIRVTPLGLLAIVMSAGVGAGGAVVLLGDAVPGALPALAAAPSPEQHPLLEVGAPVAVGGGSTTLLELVGFGTAAQPTSDGQQRATVRLRNGSTSTLSEVEVQVVGTDSRGVSYSTEPHRVTQLVGPQREVVVELSLPAGGEVREVRTRHRMELSAVHDLATLRARERRAEEQRPLEGDQPSSAASADSAISATGSNSSSGTSARNLDGSVSS